MYKIKYYGSMEEATFTIGEILDAIEANGLPQIKGSYWQVDDTGISSACAVGMAAINLRFSWSDLEAALFKIKLRNGKSLAQGIVYHNDRLGESFKQIANFYREKLKNSLDTSVQIRGRRLIVEAF